MPISASTIVLLFLGVVISLLAISLLEGVLLFLGVVISLLAVSLLEGVDILSAFSLLYLRVVKQLLI